MQDRHSMPPDSRYESDLIGRPATRLLLMLAALLILAGTLMTLLTPSHISGTPLFTAAPLIVAFVASTAATALTGLLSTGLLAATLLLPGGMSTLQDHLTRVVTLAVVSVLATGISWFVRRRGAALASARSVAETAQFAVLPVPLPRAGELRIAVRYEAAAHGAQIGGDLYAVQETPHGVRVLLGDVRGKGLAAVGTVVILLGAFREAAEQEPTLEGVADRLDRALLRERRPRGGEEDLEGFTTALLAEFTAGGERTLRVLNRGHPAPLLLQDGRPRFLDPSEPCLPLGLSELGSWRGRVQELPFPPGLQILFYTDGLTEARNRSGTFFDPGTRLAGCVFDDPAELLDRVLADVRAHAGGRVKDDMALMAVQRDRSPD